MAVTVREMPDLELALLRRGVDELSSHCERCRHCGRSPLVGERVWELASGAIVCELCRDPRREPGTASRTVHGPEFGHTMRITDQRAAA